MHLKGMLELGSCIYRADSPCHPIEYGKEHSNRLSYLISNCFMMLAKSASDGDDISFKFIAFSPLFSSTVRSVRRSTWRLGSSRVSYGQNALVVCSHVHRSVCEARLTSKALPPASGNFQPLSSPTHAHTVSVLTCMYTPSPSSPFLAAHSPPRAVSHALHGTSSDCSPGKVMYVCGFRTSNGEGHY